MEQWAAAVFQGDTEYERTTLNSAALGEIKGYDRIIELDYEKLKEVLGDEE